MNEKERRITTWDEISDFLLYTAPNGQVTVECILHDETIWLSQKRIAELFGVGVPVISKHLYNIFESGELERESTVSILETVQQGKLFRKRKPVSGIQRIPGLRRLWFSFPEAG